MQLKQRALQVLKTNKNINIMKEYQVTLRLGEDKQWVSVWADSIKEAKEIALQSISIVKIIEIN